MRECALCRKPVAGRKPPHFVIVSQAAEVEVKCDVCDWTGTREASQQHACEPPGKGEYRGKRDREGKRHGFGIFTYDDGAVYTGEWSGGKCHGQGGHVSYDGAWVDDKKHGQGTYKWSDGNEYEGQWVDGERTGEGTFAWGDGAYTGAFLKGARQGRGVYKWPNGDRFSGEWSGGERTGYGKLVTSRQSGNATVVTTYFGEWKNNKKHGEGMQSEKRGNGKQNVTQDGTWKDDAFVR